MVSEPASKVSGTGLDQLIPPARDPPPSAGVIIYLIEETLPPAGPKQWSSKLSPRQRRLLEALPVAAPAEQSVKDARQAAFTRFFAKVPAIAAGNGVAWPAELDAAVKTYLSTAGLPLPGAE